MSRKRGRVSLPEYASMARRVIRAYAVRFEVEGDAADLKDLVELLDEVNASITSSIDSMRSRTPVPWAEVGKELGMSGENARQRWATDVYPNLPTVYGLRSPGGTEYRYVGQSARPTLRILSYRRGRAHTPALRDWMSDREAGGGARFEVDILETCATDDEVNAAEKKWIAHFRSEGHRLLNVSSGGSAHRNQYAKAVPLSKACPQTEIRWVHGRRVAPVEVRCTLLRDHEGDCMRSGVAFGNQAETSDYAKYMLEKRGIEINLEDYEKNETPPTTWLPAQRRFPLPA